MTKLFVVDGNWYLHRCFFTIRSSRPLEEVLPQNFLGLVMKDACALKATHVMVAFDGPKVFRYDIFPDYKANRTESKEAIKVGKEDDDEPGRDIYSALPATRELLDKCGVVWIQPKKYEADDVLASVSRQYRSVKVEGKRIKVVLGSQDKDGYQSLAANVTAYNSAAQPPQVIDIAMAEKSKGVTIDQMVMYQTLIGDAIDNIPQLMKPGEAKKTIKRWGSFKAWFAGATKEEKRWLIANQVKLRLNRQLVEMKIDINLPELNELRVAKLRLENMPRAWYAYMDLMYPKSKSLFRR